jgi:methionyl-tRNA formyltransferase
MDATVDTGAIYAQKGIVIPFPIRGSELHSLLQEEIIALFRSAWPRMLSGELQPVPQIQGGSSFRRKQTNLDRVRDANMMMPLKETVLWMLAHDFYPGTTAELEESGERYRLRIFVEKIG